jgi:hypothetical protein
MLLLELGAILIAFAIGYACGRSRSRRWNWHHTREEGDWSHTVLFHESEKDNALAYQRQFAEYYRAAKARGLIH